MTRALRDGRVFVGSLACDMRTRKSRFLRGGRRLGL